MASPTITISRTAVHEGDRQLRRTCIRCGEDFREIRLRAGVSQAAVARAVGVARSVICRIEQGDPDVSSRIRARAAAALGADLRISIYAESARTHVVLVLPPTRHHRALVAAHPRIVASAYPASSGALRSALTDPVAPWPGDGILWLSPKGGDRSRSLRT